MKKKLKVYVVQIVKKHRQSWYNDKKGFLYYATDCETAEDRKKYFRVLHADYQFYPCGFKPIKRTGSFLIGKEDCKIIGKLFLQ